MSWLTSLASVSGHIITAGAGVRISYTVTPDTSATNEGTTVTFAVATTGILNGTTLYWTNSGTTAAGDFSDATNSGSFTITNGSASITRTLTNDAVTEGPETIILNIRTDSVSGTIVATSSTVTVNDTSVTPTYAITANTSSVNEGASVLFTVNTTSIANGTALYWTNSGNTSSVDFNDSINSGSVTISNNSATISRTLANDLTTEGTESVILNLRLNSTSGTIVANSGTVTVADTSAAPTISANVVTSINEGLSVTYTVTANTADGTTLYWTNSGTTDGADFSDGNNSGSFTITSNTATISRTISSDLTTEGSETIILNIRSGSTSGTILANSASLTVNDVSIAPVIVANTSSVNEGASVLFTITANTADSTTLYWTNAGTTTNADFSDSLNSGSFTITSNTGTVTRTLTNDLTSEGTETIVLQVRSGSTSGTILATSSNVSVNDTSLTPATYAITQNTTSVNEGSSVLFTVNTGYIANGTVLYWTNTGTTVNADFNADGGSVALNGSSQYLSSASNTSHDIAGSDFTIEMFAKFNTTTGALVSKYGAANTGGGAGEAVGGFGYVVQFTATALRLVLGPAAGGGDQVNSFAWSRSTGTWYHIAIVRSGSSIKAFVDGTQIGTTLTSVADVASLNQLQIGKTHTTSEYLNGNMTNLRIVKGSALYNSNFTKPLSVLNATTDTNLLLNFANTAGLLTDSSGKNFTIVNNGTATFDTSYPYSNNMQGQVTISNNAATFVKTLSADATTEGAETILINLRTASVAGTIVANSSSITVNDTSLNPTYAVSSNASSITESDSVLFTITTTDTSNGTVLYWTNSGNTVAADFSDSLNSGSITISNNSATVTRTLSRDSTTEGSETLILQVRTGSVGGTVVATSNTITVADTSNTTISANVSVSINEGSSVTYTITTDNIANSTVLYWTNSGTTTGADFSDGNNSGAFTITNNSAAITRTLASDLTTEGSETLILQVRSGSISGTILGTAASLTVNDVSAAPTILANTASVNEGASVLFTITANTADGTTLYWTNSGTTTNADFSDSLNSGSFNITSNTGTVTRTLTNDLTTEGTETIILQVRSGSTSGTVLVTSSNVNVNDTSTTPDYFITPNTFSANEGTTVLFNVTTANTANNTTLYWTNSGTTANADFDADGGSILFNGSNQYLSYSQNTVHDIAGSDFTLEFWIRPAASSGGIISKYGATYLSGGAAGETQGGYGYLIQYTPSVLRLVTGLGGLSDQVMAFSWPGSSLNVWQHVAIARSGTSVKAFVNGSQIGSTATQTTPTYASLNPLHISHTHTSGYPGEVYSGYLSNLRLIKGAALYTANFTPPISALNKTTQTSLLLNVTNAASIITDSSTNNLTPTNNNGATYNALYPLAANNMQGQVLISNNSASFIKKISADNTTEGAETIIMNLRSSNVAGTIVATSNTITVNDTSHP